MTPPRSIMSVVFGARWFRDAWRRRLTFGVLALMFAILSVWPRPYVARAILAPEESSGGLSSLLAQAGALVNLNTLVGNRGSIEDDLVVGRSQAIVRAVIAELNLVHHHGFSGEAATEIRLRKMVDVSAIRGSVLQVEVRGHDPTLIQGIGAAYVKAIQTRLTALTLAQTAQKRAVAENRMRDASVRLANAQQAITQFRSANHLAAPEIQLGAGVSLLAGLQGRLDAKEAEVRALQQFATSRNVELQAAQAEVASLQSQIEKSRNSADTGGSPTLQGLNLVNSQYFNLYRDERFAETLYDVYNRYSEEIAIDELTANSNIEVVEPTYIDPDRQYNVFFVLLLVVDLCATFLAEAFIVYPNGLRHA